MDLWIAEILKNYPHSIFLLKEIGSPIVAFVVALIASYLQYNQWRTSRNSLSLSLFEERFDIYQKLMLVINDRNSTEFNSELSHYFYGVAIHKAQFLFNKETYEFLILISNMLSSHREIFSQWQQIENRNGIVTEEQQNLAEQKRLLSAEIDEYCKKIPGYFDGTMNFSKI
jgi:hypothetical protein